jgi:hypothetical protein
MATAKPKTKKLVYEATKVAIKQGDKHTLPDLGAVTVENIHASRKKHGAGRVTVKSADGKSHDVTPAAINAIWI